MAMAKHMTRAVEDRATMQITRPALRAAGTPTKSPQSAQARTNTIVARKYSNKRGGVVSGSHHRVKRLRRGAILDSLRI
jgi:hypothetical protein